MIWILTGILKIKSHHKKPIIIDMVHLISFAGCLVKKQKKTELLLTHITKTIKKHGLFSRTNLTNYLYKT